MIGNQITGSLMTLVAIGSLAMSTSAYFKGKHDGVEKERAVWNEGVGNAENRADDAETKFQDGENTVPTVVARETKTIIKYDNAAIRKVARLEGQIVELKWELKNVENTGACIGNIPDEWMRQQQKLDRILQGVSKAGDTRSHQSETVPLGREIIIPSTVRD